MARAKFCSTHGSCPKKYPRVMNDPTQDAAPTRLKKRNFRYCMFATPAMKGAKVRTTTKNRASTTVFPPCVS